VISVVIPPLRDRRDDILPLARKLMRDFAGAFVRDIHGFTPAAEQALLEHPWCGNVRELRNCVERAVALSVTPWIGVHALLSSEPAEPLGAEARYRTLAEVRDLAERDHIRAVRAHVGTGVEEIAKVLGVSRRTVFEKMRKLNLRSDV
jgi:two-component system, NtrC family, response regulator AtoC